ncbi:MAG: hypothetical protein U0Z26_09210 [Anaerolineales bacterium]
MANTVNAINTIREMKKNKLPRILLLVALLSAMLFLIYHLGNNGNNSFNLTNDLPIILVDNNHNFQFSRDNSIVPRYEIKAGSGFILDLSEYKTWKTPTYCKQHTVLLPNRIEIIQKGDYNGQVLGFTYNIFYADIKSGETSYSLTPKTLLPSNTFNGLDSGESITVGIVIHENNGLTCPLWSAGIDIH